MILVLSGNLIGFWILKILKSGCSKLYICTPFIQDIKIMGQGPVSYYIRKTAKFAETVLITSKKYRILKSLKDEGVHVKINPKLHAKLFLIRRGRGGLAIVGSANLTYGGICRNEEIAILVDESKILNKLEVEFNRIRVRSKDY